MWRMSVIFNGFMLYSNRSLYWLIISFMTREYTLLSSSNWFWPGLLTKGENQEIYWYTWYINIYCVFVVSYIIYVFPPTYSYNWSTDTSIFEFCFLIHNLSHSCSNYLRSCLCALQYVLKYYSWNSEYIF